MGLIDSQRLAEVLFAEDSPQIYTHGDLAVIINSMPTVDAEPVRHEVWESIYGERTEKSFGDIVLKEYACSNCLHREKKKTRYCPNCGAKMDGE